MFKVSKNTSLKFTAKIIIQSFRSGQKLDDYSGEELDTIKIK